MTQRQNRYAEAIVAGLATDSTIRLSTTYAQEQGEVAFATDTKILYIGNSNTTGGDWLPTAAYLPYISKTANYTLTLYDYLVNCTANSFDITLPTAVGCTGRSFIIKNTGTGIITIKTTSSQTIDGVASGVLTLVQWDSLRVTSDGANWIIT